MGKKNGRPFVHNVDIELLREMQIKGFTGSEVCEYFNLPYNTMRWYARKNNIGRFKTDSKNKMEKEVIKYLEIEHYTQDYAARLLGTYQSNISRIYREFKNKEQKKKERFEWLKKRQDVRDAEGN